MWKLLNISLLITQERRGKIILWRCAQSYCEWVSFWCIDWVEIGLWAKHGRLSPLIFFHWSDPSPKCISVKEKGLFWVTLRGSETMSFQSFPDWHFKLQSVCMFVFSNIKNKQTKTKPGKKKEKGKIFRTVPLRHSHDLHTLMEPLYISLASDVAPVLLHPYAAPNFLGESVWWMRLDLMSPVWLLCASMSMSTCE